MENAIPLERQVRLFGNEGLPVAPSTLEDLYKRTADALLPLYERMVDRIMQCDILHVDETFIKQLVKGAKKCKQAYLWCRLTGVGPPMIAYHFSPSRSRDVAERLLGDYSGTIIRDSYVAYEKLDCEVATPEQSSETLTWPMKNWTARLPVAGLMSADVFCKLLKEDIRKQRLR